MRCTFGKAFAAAAVLGCAVVGSEALDPPGARHKVGTRSVRSRDRAGQISLPRSAAALPARSIHLPIPKPTAALPPVRSRSRAQLRPFRRSANIRYPTRLRPFRHRPGYRDTLRRQRQYKVRDRLVRDRLEERLVRREQVKRAACAHQCAAYPDTRSRAWLECMVQCR
jgi:hypothetical protein